MQQRMADWLEKLGVSEYARTFAENDIDFSVLSDLTDQHLKDLGVSSLGHRDLLRRTDMTIFLLRLKFYCDPSQVRRSSSRLPVSSR